MSNKKLTPEIVSLIHHLELNKAGWWESSVETFITIHLYINPSGLTISQLAKILTSEYSINIDSDQCTKALERLQSKRIVIKQHGDSFKLTEAELTRNQEKISTFCELENKVKTKFELITEQLIPEITNDGIWNKFNTDFLTPYVQETGAKAYEVISGKKIDLNGKKCLEKFLGSFDQRYHEKLKQAVIGFFDPQDAGVRTYIHKQLRASFCVDAAKLNKASVDNITSSLSKPAKIKIFLDTNFLFSILNLHDNPANEAAKILITTIEALKPKLNITLYISPMTLEESNNVLIYQVEKLKGLHLNQRILDSLATSSGLSGLTMKFINANRDAKIKQTPEEFFSPYINNLQLLSREHGIELYNKKVDSYRKEQDVIDEILAQIQFEKDRGYKPIKTYEQQQHDITLMHLVKDLRPPAIENPLDAIYWITTIDYRFLAYDKYKLRSNRFALCIHPTTLIQMIDLWIPRNETLEQALVGNLRLPLLALQDFDREAEEVTLKILSTLSTYENIEHLDKKTITEILVNKNLRQHLTAETPLEEQIQLVHSALIEQHDKITIALKTSEEERQQLQTILSEKETENKLILEKLQIYEQKQSDLDDTVNREKTRSTKLELELERIKEKTSLTVYYITVPLFCICLATFLIYKASPSLGINKTIFSIVTFLLLVPAWIYVSGRRAKEKLHRLDDDRLYILLLKLRKASIWILATIILATLIGFFVNFSTELIKNDFPEGKVSYENMKNWITSKLKSDPSSPLN